jgi:hypothetical protein
LLIDSSNGTYCYFDPSPNSNFTCNDECAANFYQAANDYPASDKQFNYYWLISIGDWWAGAFADGWARLVKLWKGSGKYFVKFEYGFNDF